MRKSILGIVLSAALAVMCLSFFDRCWREPMRLVVRAWDDFAAFAKTTLELSLPVLKQVNLKFTLPKEHTEYRSKSDLALGFHLHSNSLCM